MGQVITKLQILLHQRAEVCTPPGRILCLRGGREDGGTMLDGGAASPRSAGCGILTPGEGENGGNGGREEQ